MAKNKEIFLVPYAHLDTQWRWEYPTTIKKYIKNTIEENIDMFEKYPGHRFNFTGAIRYNMMKEYYPEKFEKVKQYIDEGRWALAGTCLDETDALVPSVESMVRNILYGDRWAKKEFGKTSRDYMIPDCFGFPANMPTVLAHCGIQGFSSQKLTWNSAIGIPFEVGVWEGFDGTGVVSALNPRSYTDKCKPVVHENPGSLERLNRLGEKNGIWKSFQYYGVGDIGGAPTEESIKRVLASIDYSVNSDTDILVRQGSADQFFSEITDEERQKMDTYCGDLLLINHSAGTLTSASIMKRWNRKNEQLAFAAETAAVTAMLKAGASYPNDKIKSAWYRVIGSQMHDILPGTSTPTAYEYSQNDEVMALNTWNTILQDSATMLAPYVKGDGTILIFNPLGENRKDVVDIELLDWDESDGTNAILKDADGNDIPVQLKKNESGKFQATFMPEMKPFSWERFTIAPNGEKNDATLNEAVTITENGNLVILENTNYRVNISKPGKVESIFHKKTGKELLKSPLAYELQKECPTKYPSWNMDWKDRKNPPFKILDSGNNISIIEQGPLRCTVQITTNYQKSTLIKEISLSHDSEIVELTERINWRGKGCSLKLALKSQMKKPKITYNWETSRINRGLNHEKLFEMPSRLWTDMSEDNWGISIIEDCKFGYDHPVDDTLRLTLLYTPAIQPFANRFLDQKYHGWGSHTIRYGIYAHEGDFKNTDHLARRFNQKIRSFLISNEDNSDKTINKEDLSLFEVSSKQIGVIAVKKPEDTDGILIRLYERYGEAVKADITFKEEILEVKEVNGIEEPIGEIPVNENKFAVNMGADSLHSYIVKLKTNQKSAEVKQEIVKLDYNCKMIGSNGESQGFYPAEITPSQINAGAITYQLSTDKELNALQCNGQILSIPDGYNTLSILISSEEETKVPLTWLDENGNKISEELSDVSAMNGFIGQWDQRKWLLKPKHYKKCKRDYVWFNMCTGVEPGYINRNRVEWYATHTHKNGEDQPYQYGYMYTLQLKVPKNAKSIKLPENNNVYVMAMTASNQSIKVISTTKLNDKFDF